MLQSAAIDMPADSVLRLNDARPLYSNDAVEKRRLENIERLDVLDTPREEAFDRITRLAQKMFQVPIALGIMLGPSACSTPNPESLTPVR